MEKQVGKVYLVGAGPGDAGLITVKGQELIGRADVIVYDRLAHPNLLLGRRPEALLIDVGKLPQDHKVPQGQIEQILIDQARAGKLVVRLKGGDPYVFGRGGEEGEALYQAGIPFEVVPGVTSAIGGLAYAGIPVTYRQEATSFHVITGHKQNEASLDYGQLAQLDGTLVFLMGFGHLKEITQGLMDEGKDPTTPAAIVQWAATARQRMVKGQLADIVEKAEAAGLSSPALICIGEVVRHQDHLDFRKDLQTLPFYGHNFLLFRQGARSMEALKKIQALGGNAYALPAIESRFLPSEELNRAIAQIESVDWIFFTSANGVDDFMQAFLAQRDIRDLGPVRFLVVGSKTREALKAYGIRADLMPENYLGEEAAQLLADRIREEAAASDQPARKPRVLAPRSKIAPPETVDPLRDCADLWEIPLYDLVLPEGAGDLIRDMTRDLDSAYLIFTSSSTFTNLKAALGEDLDGLMAKSQVVTIGPTCSATIRQAGYTVDLQADRYTLDGIIEKIRESLGK